MGTDGDALARPAVVCVRGVSRSGKTSLCERLIPRLAARGLRVAYVKRTHHQLDLPEKASSRIWVKEPSAMIIRTADRTQLTLPPVEHDSDSVLAAVPPTIDLVLLETHTREEFPTLLLRSLPATDDEDVIGTWALESIDEDAARLVDVVEASVPVDVQLGRALRAASGFHGGHVCAGLVLGTRLALHGLSLLDIETPPAKKRLIVTVETDRCAVDAIQAVTGCRPGKRTLRLLDYGKLAATFVDQWTGNAVRVAVRGDVREHAGAEGADRHEVQRHAYLHMRPEELFTASPADGAISQFDLPGPPRRRVICLLCSEEVSDGREVVTDIGLTCRPCARSLPAR
jgi:formylmethanofuran dehydrogenase subunit E